MPEDNEPAPSEVAARALEEYLAAVDKQRAEAERQRRDHPLPDLPSQTCR